MNISNFELHTVVAPLECAIYTLNLTSTLSFMHAFQISILNMKFFKQALGLSRILVRTAVDLEVPPILAISWVGAHPRTYRYLLFLCLTHQSEVWPAFTDGSPSQFGVPSSITPLS
jgi:hypothetical protein